MKKKKIFALMAAALSLTACSTNDVADITHDDADNVVNVASVTRSGEGASTTSPMTAPFHLINITQATKRNVNFEADFTYDNNTNKYAQTGDSKVVWYNVKDADGNEIPNEFKAFSPIKTDKNNASLETFNLPTDQSSATLLQSADWMTGKPDPNPIKKSAAPSGLALNFSHNYSKLCFNVVPQEDITESALSSADIKVLGSIKPYYNSTFKTIEAIVEPKDYTTNDEIIQISLSNGGESYALNFLQPITFEAGKQYNYSLKLGHNAITISSVSVTGWTQASVATGKENEAWNGSNALKLTFSGNLTGAKLVLTYHYTEPQTSNNAKTRTVGPSHELNLTKHFEIRTPNNAEGIEVVIKSEKNSSIAEIPLKNDANIVLLSAKGINTNGTTNFTFSDNETLVPGYLTIGVTGDSENVKDIKLDVSGDLRSLVNASDPKNADTSKAKFTNLFKDCKQLKSFEKIQLNEMADNCCEAMFENSELEQSPILPDQTSQNCYINMFKNCIDLKQVVLPAAGLSPGCYNGVLSGCVNLEYLKLGVTNENLKTLNDKENPPFGNLMGQDDKQEIRNDDGTTTIIDTTAGSKVDQRILVVNVGVDINELVLPSLWTDTNEGANLIFAD